MGWRRFSQEGNLNGYIVTFSLVFEDFQKYLKYREKWEEDVGSTEIYPCPKKVLNTNVIKILIQNSRKDELVEVIFVSPARSE